MRSRSRVCLAVTAALSLSLPLLTPAAVAAADGPSVTVVASGLNNPRSLAFAPNGHLLVAEAGAGGATCLPGGEEGVTCIGLTGSVADVSEGHVRRVVTGLLSLSGEGGSFAIGPDGLAIHGTGGVDIQMGESTSGVPSEAFAAVPAAEAAALRTQTGRLLQATPSGHLRTVADVGDFDYAWTQAHPELGSDFPDANPYGIVSLAGRTYVADAGANTLTEVRANGSMRVVAHFPDPAPEVNPFGRDAVPTCVAEGPDGALYVGQLGGGGVVPGGASVYRVVPGGAPSVWRTGFTAITGCGFGPDGSFYATELALAGLNDTPGPPLGAVVKVAPDNSRTLLGVGHLFAPQGFAMDRHGAIFVSNWSIAPASGLGPNGPTGQVVRIG